MGIVSIAFVFIFLINSVASTRNPYDDYMGEMEETSDDQSEVSSWSDEADKEEKDEDYERKNNEPVSEFDDDFMGEIGGKRVHQSDLKTWINEADDRDQVEEKSRGRRELKDVHNNFFPVNIQLNKNTYCGGTMITDRHILTAAHCFFHEDLCSRSFNVAYWKATIFNKTGIAVDVDGDCVDCSDHDHKRTTRHHNIVENIQAHPGYVRSHCSKNDVAVVTLKKAVIKADGKFKVFIGGKKVKDRPIVAGFGFDPEHPNQSVKYLNKLDATVQACTVHDATADHICMEEKESDVCQGDSGSGLVSIYRDGSVVIHGTVAAGTDCKLIHAAKLQKRAGLKVEAKFTGGVFTRVSSYYRFICKTTDGKVLLSDGMVCPKTSPIKPLKF